MFKYRILVVDDDPKFRATSESLLTQKGYEVCTAADGFEALLQLRGPLPNIIISELGMPKMSGFELLSIVRRRFPSIAVIAISGTYNGALGGVIADSFLSKGQYSPEQLLSRIVTLIEGSPLRPQLAKPDKAPIWIPRDKDGYFVVTCPECLRSFSVEDESDLAELRTSPCTHCQTELKFLATPAVAAHKVKPKAK